MIQDREAKVELVQLGEDSKGSGSDSDMLLNSKEGKKSISTVQTRDLEENEAEVSQRSE